MPDCRAVHRLSAGLGGGLALVLWVAGARPAGAGLLLGTAVALLGLAWLERSTAGLGGVGREQGRFMARTGHLLRLGLYAVALTVAFFSPRVSYWATVAGLQGCKVAIFLLALGSGGSRT